MAAASVRLAAPSLPRMLETWTLAVFGVMNNSAAISLLLLPCATSRSTSCSRPVSAWTELPGVALSAARGSSLARRPRSSRAARSGAAPSLSAVVMAASQVAMASSRRPASTRASARRHCILAVSYT